MLWFEYHICLWCRASWLVPSPTTSHKCFTLHLKLVLYSYTLVCTTVELRWRWHISMQSGSIDRQIKSENVCCSLMQYMKCIYYPPDLNVLNLNCNIGFLCPIVLCMYHINSHCFSVYFHGVEWSWLWFLSCDLTRYSVDVESNIRIVYTCTLCFLFVPHQERSVHIKY